MTGCFSLGTATAAASEEHAPDEEAGEAGAPFSPADEPPVGRRCKLTLA